MRFLSVVLGSAAALAIPAFLVLYFLKRRYETTVVPSTRLWREAISSLHADRPWQRLRTGLLFFLQLAAILLLVFAVFRPVSGTQLPQEMVVVLDCSGSMQATDVAPSRFEQAKTEAARILDGLPSGGRITVIAAGARAELVLSRAADRVEARRVLASLRPENGNGAMTEALELASALSRETGAGVAVLSDRYSGGSAVTIGAGGANRAVETISASRVNGQLQALTVIRSYGFTGTVAAECRADGKLVDVREAELPLGDTAVLYWANLPQDARQLNVRLVGQDALAPDDSADCVVTAGETKKVLLVTGGNAFLEAALKLREDVELYKQAPSDGAELKGYDLYVFDGDVPEQLPQDGGVIAFQPSGKLDGLEAAESQGGALSAATGTQAASLLRNVDPGKIKLAKAAAFTLSGQWQPLVWLNDKAAIAVCEQGGQRVAAFGFDLHDSNLPLLKEFPILMQNLLTWIMSDVTGGVSMVSAGNSVPLLPHALSARIEVLTPSGASVAAAPPFPAAPFAGTGELGVYEVRQYGPDGKELSAARSGFAVNFPTSTESDLAAVEPLPALAGAGEGPRAVAVTNWWLIAAAAAFALVLGEWLVTRYGR